MHKAAGYRKPKWPKIFPTLTSRNVHKFCSENWPFLTHFLLGALTPFAHLRELLPIFQISHFMPRQRLSINLCDVSLRRFILQSADSARITNLLGESTLVLIMSGFLLLKSGSEVFLCLTIRRAAVKLGRKGNLERPCVKRIWLRRKGSK